MSPVTSVSVYASYANDLHIAPDGVIYFSDSSVIAPMMNKLGFYDTLAAYMLTQLQVRHAFGSTFLAGFGFCVQSVIEQPELLQLHSLSKAYGTRASGMP